MEHRERVQFLAKQPPYRAKLVCFIALSVATLGFSFVFKDPITQEILREFAVTLGAVGILQVLWDILGGEPIELRIDELEQEVKDIQSSLGVLVHLTDSEVGIERVWAKRGEWQHEPSRLTEWHDWVCKAKKVDIVSNTFWSNWMSDRKFRQELFEHAKSEDCERIRILIYEPGSSAQKCRAKAEPGDRGQMKKEIEFTLDEIKAGRTAFGLSAGGKLQVGITHSLLHPAQIIRADDRMLVSTYLIGEGGSKSPTMQIRGTGSAYFETYKTQFEAMWDRAKII